MRCQCFGNITVCHQPVLSFQLNRVLKQKCLHFVGNTYPLITNVESVKVTVIKMMTARLASSADKEVVGSQSRDFNLELEKLLTIPMEILIIAMTQLIIKRQRLIGMLTGQQSMHCLLDRPLARMK